MGKAPPELKGTRFGQGDSTFIFGDRIGSGSFGDVYVGQRIRGHQVLDEVAIKIESIEFGSPQLKRESEAFDVCGSQIAVQKFYYGKEKELGYYVLVISLLGVNLERAYKSCDRTFSLDTVLGIADQMLTLLETIHSNGYLHRDLKPENIVLGYLPDNPIPTSNLTNYKPLQKLHLIDFGLSKKYVKSMGENVRHIWGGKIGDLSGTQRYMSINTHCGMEQGRRDDLESLAYILLYLLHGSLPWQGLSRSKNPHLKTLQKKSQNQAIRDKKKTMSINVLCKDLPLEFKIYLEYCKGLRFEETPDYEWCRRLFGDLKIREKKRVAEEAERQKELERLAAEGKLKAKGKGKGKSTTTTTTTAGSRAKSKQPLGNITNTVSSGVTATTSSSALATPSINNNKPASAGKGEEEEYFEYDWIRFLVTHEKPALPPWREAKQKREEASKKRKEKEEIRKEKKKKEQEEIMERQQRQQQKEKGEGEGGFGRIPGDRKKGRVGMGGGGAKQGRTPFGVITNEA